MNTIIEIFLNKSKPYNLASDDSIYHNPWPGLDSYRRESKNGFNYLFCGRNKEVQELFSLINRNLIVTLYGKSGIGKSSLINAGLTPVLEEQSYLPIIIRLGEGSREKDFAESIAEVINNTINNTPNLYCYMKEEDDVERSKDASSNSIINNIDEEIKDTHMSEDNSQKADMSGIDYLLDFFVNREFHKIVEDNNGKKENRIVFPVIILDQFEEIFRIWKRRAQHLLLQLNELTTDYYKGEEVTTNFRFLLSIREDDLYLLEEALDENYIQSMKRNRYRLRRLEETSAKEVIIKPGQGFIPEEDADKIMNNIINASKDNDDRVSSLLLSLICSRLFQEALRNSKDGKIPIITLEMTESISKEYLQAFYKEIISRFHLTRKQQEALETLENRGRREPIPYSYILKYFDSNLLEKLTKGEYAILRKLEDHKETRIELIHDAFCSVISNQKLERQKGRQQFIEYLLLIPLYISILYLDRKIYPYSIAHETHTTGIYEDFCHFFHNYFYLAVIFFPEVALGLARKVKPTKGFILFSLILALLPLVYDYFLHRESEIYSIGYYSSYGLYNLPISIYIICLAFVVLCIVTWKYTRNAYKYNLGDSKANSILLLVSVLVFTYYRICESPAEGINYYHVLDFLVFPFFSWSIISFYKGHLVLENLYSFIIVCIITIALIFGLNNFDFYLPGQILTKLCIITLLWFFVFSKWLSYVIEKKKRYLFCVINTVSIALYLVFLLGYNPLVIKANVNISNQASDIWKWKTVVIPDENHNGYKCLNALNGKLVLSEKIDTILGENRDNLIFYSNTKLTDYDGHYLSLKDSKLKYKYSSTFEYNHIERVNNKDSVALLLEEYRKAVLSSIVRGANVLNSYLNDSIFRMHEIVSDKEIYDLKKLLYDDRRKFRHYSPNDKKEYNKIIEDHLSHMLCKTISNFWLKEAIKSNDLLQIIPSFDFFVISHYYLDIFPNTTSIDWDTLFEEMINKCLETTGKLTYPSDILSSILDYYDNSLGQEFKLKVLLYQKIVYLKQLIEIDEELNNRIGSMNKIFL